jgi:hypothetical protein
MIRKVLTVISVIVIFLIARYVYQNFFFIADYISGLLVDLIKD